MLNLKRYSLLLSSSSRCLFLVCGFCGGVGRTCCFDFVSNLHYADRRFKWLLASLHVFGHVNHWYCGIGSAIWEVVCYFNNMFGGLALEELPSERLGRLSCLTLLFRSSIRCRTSYLSFAEDELLGFAYCIGYFRQDSKQALFLLRGLFWPLSRAPYNLPSKRFTFDCFWALGAVLASYSVWLLELHGLDRFYSLRTSLWGAYGSTGTKKFCFRLRGRF